MAGKKTANVVDLFSGVGGLSLGAARAGFTVSGAVEIDKIAINSHKQNFRETIHLEQDVSPLTGERLRNLLDLKNGDLTGIIGGPPCQGFSSIGKNDVNDTRNSLFPEFFRLVSEALPKFYLAENVPGILKGKNSAILKKANAYVEKLYTVLPAMVLSANDYGAPTTRTRVFFIGFRKDEMESLSIDDFLPDSESETVLVKDAFEGLPRTIDPSWQKESQSWQIAETRGKSRYTSRLQGHIPIGLGDQNALQRLKNEKLVSGFLGTRHSKEVADRYASIECGKSDPISRSYKLDFNGFCPTLRAGTGRDHGGFQAVRPLHPTEPRVITPREAARLQGFPDWFQFSHTKWHSFRQIGNSVSPILSEQIMSVIHKSLGS